MRWLISVFYLWFILEYIIHPIGLILAVIPMQKKPIQNYFDNHLGTRETGRGNEIACFCGKLDPNCVSQDITQKNDWESGRFCNTGAICVLWKTLQSLQEDAFSAYGNVSFFIPMVQNSNSAKVARAWAVVARSVSRWKTCSYPVRTLWLSHVYLTHKGPTGACSCKFSFQYR